MSNATTTQDEKLAKDIGDQISADLSMIIDRELAISSVTSERVQARVAGEGAIHLSFRIEFQVGAEKNFGCLLMPLPAAIGVACYLMVMSDEEVKSQRELNTLERSMKDAMLEVGNFVGGSSDAVVRKWNSTSKMSARSAGCQGVAPGAVPNFDYAKGSDLILARLQAKLGNFDAFEMILMLPSALLGGDES